MYLRPRLIPCLSIINNDLVKTTQFKKPKYIGDPVNAVKIFNTKGVDELCILDIRATENGKEPNFSLLQEIASEAFIPLSYGGGIKSVSQAKKIFQIGYEKVIINSEFYTNEQLIRDIVKFAGSQSVVISIDVKKKGNKHVCYLKSGTKDTGLSVEEMLIKAQRLGAGEVIVNSIDNDGRMCGLDFDLVSKISKVVDMPVIIMGGAKNVSDFKTAIELGIHAVAASSMFVFYGPLKAVLITYPSDTELDPIM